MTDAMLSAHFWARMRATVPFGPPYEAIVTALQTADDDEHPPLPRRQTLAAYEHETMDLEAGRPWATTTTTTKATPEEEKDGGGGGEKACTAILASATWPRDAARRCGAGLCVMATALLMRASV